jgi:hypothetical protein
MINWWGAGQHLTLHIEEEEEEDKGIYISMLRGVVTNMHAHTHMHTCMGTWMHASTHILI